MKKEEKQNVRKLMALLLVAGLLVTLVALVSTPPLLAQDDIDKDDGSDVIVVSSIEDLESLPAHIREQMPKPSSFSSEDDYEFGQSTKTAGREFVVAGEEVTFTIEVLNSGGHDSPPIVIVDELPSGLTYVSHEFKLPGGLQTGGGVENNVITWEGVLNAAGGVEIVVVARVDKNAPIDTTYTNQAEVKLVSDGEVLAQPATTITVVDKDSIPIILLPMITYGERPLTPDIISIESTKPNKTNNWTVSWNGAGAVEFELQEAHDPGFSDAVSMPGIRESSKSFAHQATRDNVYYYRVRSRVGELTGNWSETLKVIGGYREDFDVPIQDTSWWIRRTTHLDAVTTWNEFPGDYKWNILNIADAYDLGLASPMSEMPSVPYSIRLELKSVDPSEGLGTGFVFAADKVTDQCPSDPNTVEGWYEHKDCFNQFYEFMLIEAAAGERLDLQLRRIHNVIWNGPGDDPITFESGKTWKELDASGLAWGDWNLLGVDVYEDHIDVFAGKRGSGLRHQMTLEENAYPGNPYFGSIATTGERPKVTARYEYFEVMPLND